MVSRQGAQPRAKRGTGTLRIAGLARSLDHFEPGLLRDILGHARTPGELDEKSQQNVLVTPKELLKRGAVTLALEGQHQLRITLFLHKRTRCPPWFNDRPSL